jgi:hypothetical protein
MINSFSNISKVHQYLSSKNSLALRVNYSNEKGLASNKLFFPKKSIIYLKDTPSADFIPSDYLYIALAIWLTVDFNSIGRM